MKQFKKHAGGGFLSGPLYETKLISLILFRLLHDDRVEDFCLGSSMDGIGHFDDICLNLKLVGRKRPIIALIQTKHRYECRSGFKYELIQYLTYSLFKVKQRFSRKDMFFRGQFHDTDCLFILYTNAEYCNGLMKDFYGRDERVQRPYLSSFSDELNEIIATGSVGYQTEYNNSDLELANENILQEEINTLAERFAKFLITTTSMNIMLDSHILRYHVILAESVVDISEVKFNENKSKKWRELTFRSSFFNTDDRILVMLRTKMYERNARNILSSLKIKVPVGFGNVDLYLAERDNNKKENRLHFLTNFIVNLCYNQSEFNDPYKIVTIDESVGAGILGLNGGIGSAIGNLLVYDNNTKLLKFTENSTSLQNNSRNMLDKLKRKITNLSIYRFDVRAVETFPKLVFDYTDEVKEMFKHAVIYDRQSNHNGVEAILIKEIVEHHRINGVNSLPVRGDTMVILYHHEIQRWWMSHNTGLYFTKFNNIYQKALYHIKISVTERQIDAMQSALDINNTFFSYFFTDSAINSLAILDIYSPSTLVITDVVSLTTLKVIQCLKREYAVLDLKYMLNLSSNDFAALNIELKNTDKMLVVTINITKHSRILHERLDELAQALKQKRIIVITNNNFIETVKEYFGTSEELYDKEQSLNDIPEELKYKMICNNRVIFQGDNVSLSLFVNSFAESIMKGAVLNKLVCNETLTIGKPLSDANYENIKNISLNRRLRLVSNEQVVDRVVETFDDITENSVLILGEERIGKSTLLTYLSLNTKSVLLSKCIYIWIVRINLIDYTREFKKWKHDKTIIDTLKVMKFICQVVLNNNKNTIYLKENGSEIYLEACTGDKDNNNDKYAMFVLNMFLQFFYRQRIIFLFDGFDEICPHYKEIVINLLKVVKGFPGDQKMWVTSRPYSDIVPDLQEAIGTSPYEIITYPIICRLGQ